MSGAIITKEHPVAALTRHSGMHVAEEIHCDVVVLGGGIAGLMCATRLANLGYSVVVVERAPRLLTGPSGRNAGWLHAGTYHAMSIADRDRAVSVATHCRHGWNAIRETYPTCINRELLPAIAIVQDSTVEAAIGRWDQVGVGYRHLSSSERRGLEEAVSLRSNECTYAVDDCGINVRLLAAALVRDLTIGGGRILLKCSAHLAGDSALELTGAHTGRLSYRFLVCAAGQSTAETCKELGLAQPRLRFWRSHLASFPRLAPASLFSLAAGEAAMVNHGEWSVVALNEDARVIDTPSCTPDPFVAEELMAAVAARFRCARRADATIFACTKVDVVSAMDAARSLDPQVLPLGERALCVLPGKMTEAPFAADVVAAAVFGELDIPFIAPRPIDARRFAEAMGGSDMLTFAKGRGSGTSGDTAAEWDRPLRLVTDDLQPR